MSCSIINKGRYAALLLPSWSVFSSPSASSFWRAVIFGREYVNKYTDTKSKGTFSLSLKERSVQRYQIRCAGGGVGSSSLFCRWLKLSCSPCETAHPPAFYIFFFFLKYEGYKSAGSCFASFYWTGQLLKKVVLLCFLFACSPGQATPFCCFSCPEPSECAGVENLFNFPTQWKTLEEGLIWTILPNWLHSHTTVELLCEGTEPRTCVPVLQGKKDFPRTALMPSHSLEVSHC